MQERRNSIANALELRLFCTNPSIWRDFVIAENTLSMLGASQMCIIFLGTKYFEYVFDDRTYLGMDSDWVHTQINPYRKTSSISRTKSQNLNVSCIILQLFSLNPLKPCVKLRMKM